MHCGLCTNLRRKSAFSKGRNVIWTAMELRGIDHSLDSSENCESRVYVISYLFRCLTKILRIWHTIRVTGERRVFELDKSRGGICNYSRPINVRMKAVEQSPTPPVVELLKLELFPVANSKLWSESFNLVWRLDRLTMSHRSDVPHNRGLFKVARFCLENGSPLICSALLHVHITSCVSGLSIWSSSRQNYTPGKSTLLWFRTKSVSRSCWLSYWWATVIPIRVVVHLKQSHGTSANWFCLVQFMVLIWCLNSRCFWPQ